MTTRTELNALLAAYETYVGGGNMKQAGRTLPKIIHALVSFVEERTPDAVEPVRRTFHIDAGNLKPEDAKTFLAEHIANPPPCAPCDVSIPNNPDLIEEFKPLAVDAIMEEEKAPPVEGEITQTDNPTADQTSEKIEIEAEAAEVVKPSVKKAVVAPAPKTLVKPKRS